MSSSLNLCQQPTRYAPLDHKPLYIAVEGPIGVGKTTLVHRLRNHINANLVLEVVEDNPFLGRFYEDPSRYALQTQLFFLMSRFKQQKELNDLKDTKDFLSDYHLLKDRIFAKLTLASEELALYDEVYGSLATSVRPPDVLVYLHAEEDELMRRIAKRARPFEDNFDRAYLSSLSACYQQHFERYEASPILMLNTTEIDYVTDDQPIADIYQELQRLAANGRAGFEREQCVSRNFWPTPPTNAQVFQEPKQA